MEQAFTLQQFLTMMKKRLWLVIAVTLCSIAIAAIISLYAVTPKYEAKTQLLVNQKTSTEEVWYQTETDLQLISTYNVLMTSSVIVSEVIERLELAVTPEQLAQQISVSNEQDSKVLNLIVHHESHEKAIEIANMWAVVIQEKIPELMKIDNINILAYAKLQEQPTPKTPNIPMNLLLGVIAGLIVSIGITFLLEIFDTTIKHERDIEELFHIPVIGVVGFMPNKKVKEHPLWKEKGGQHI